MASYADKGQNASPKAKKDKTESGALMRKIELNGSNIVLAYDDASKARKNFFGASGTEDNIERVQAVKDYIFGKSDTNPLESITAERDKKIKEHMEKTDKLIDPYKKDKFVNS